LGRKSGVPPDGEDVSAGQPGRLSSGKKRFLDAMAAANVAYSLCSTLDGAKDLHLELAFVSHLSGVLRKTRDGGQETNG